MHARRMFYEAKTSDPVRSHLVLAWVGGLDDVEELLPDHWKPSEPADPPGRKG